MIEQEFGDVEVGSVNLICLTPLNTLLSCLEVIVSLTWQYNRLILEYAIMALKRHLLNSGQSIWWLRGNHSLNRLFSLVMYAYKAPPPPPLSSFRVTKQPLFTFTGVDYAGPLLVRPDHPVHAPCEQKVWLCVYTCYVTRAIHIDIVTNLPCLSFIRSFKRFTARRGLSHKDDL